MSEATLFRNKHRPASIHEIVWPTDHARETIFKEYVDGRSTNPLLLHGPPGTGKTEIAKLIPFAMWPDYEGQDLKIETGSRRAGNTLISAIETHLSTIPYGSYRRALLVDEVEAFPSHFQREFRGLINEYEGWAFFIFTTNDRSSLDEALISRCREVNIDRAMTADRWLSRAKAILAKEGVMADEADVLNIITAAKCEGRKVLEGLYSYICRVKPPEPLDVEKIRATRPGLMSWSD